METTVKAIETEYNGYKFRSRLEARWAYFFDLVGVKYVYEQEGFENGEVRYLPDFYLPEQRIYVEVKGDEEEYRKDIEKKILPIMNDESCKIKRLMIMGNVPYPDTDNSVYWFPVYYYDTLSQRVELCYKAMIEDGHIILDWYTPKWLKEQRYYLYKWLYDKNGGMKVTSFINETEIKRQIEREAPKLDPIYDCEVRDDDYNYGDYGQFGSDELKQAYIAVRSARFEYGETPEVPNKILKE